MKKIIVLLLLFGISLLFVKQTYGADLLILDGITWEIEDSEEIEFEYHWDVNTDKLHIIPSETDYLGVNPVNPLSYSIVGNDYVATTLTDFNYSYYLLNGYYFISRPNGDPINEDVQYDINLTNNSPSVYVDDLFTHIVAIVDGNYYISKTSDIASTDILAIKQEVEFILDYDSGEEEYFVNEWYNYGLQIGTVIIIPFTESYTNIEIYLTNSLYPPHTNFDTGLTKQYWMGYQTDNTYPFRSDYVINYFREHIGIYANTQEELEDLWTDYINMWNDEGLTITFDNPVYEIGLFIPSYYDEAIDEWLELTSPPYTSINIKLPDFYLDGGIGNININETGFFESDVWGKQLVYTVNGTDVYNYTLGEDVTLYGYDLIDRFGFYISTDAYLIKWNTNGGSLIADEFIAQGSTVNYKIPSLSGYQFMGWNQLNNLKPFIDFLDPLPAGTMQGIDFPRTPQGSMTYYAVWRPLGYTVTFNFMGGTIKYPYTQHQLTVLINQTVNQNLQGYNLNNFTERVGYSLTGWYSDEALTTPFNLTTPITNNIQVYAKWTYTGLGQNESPTALNQFIDSIGLLNDGGLFLIYTVLTIFLFLLFAVMGLHPIASMIVQLLITALFIYLGWFNIWTTVLLILVVVLFVVIIMKRGT